MSAFQHLKHQSYGGGANIIGQHCGASAYATGRAAVTIRTLSGPILNLVLQDVSEKLFMCRFLGISELLNYITHSPGRLDWFQTFEG